MEPKNTGPKLAEVLAISNQRGGVGKTTTAMAIAQAAALDRKKALLIDLDPQMNATAGLAGNPAEGNAYNIFEGQAAADAIQPTPQGIDLIAGTWNLGTVASYPGSAQRLKKALEPIRGLYDYILIDCPPTFGELQMNALQAATGLIIPIKADYFTLQTFYQFATTAQQFQRTNPALQIKGIVCTRYDKRSTVARQMHDTIVNAAGEMGIPFLCDIRAGCAVEEAQALQENLFTYAPKSNPASDYLTLYNIIKREE